MPLCQGLLHLQAKVVVKSQKPAQVLKEYGVVAQIWDLESKSIVDELRPEFMPAGKKAQIPYCTCLNWSADGATLYSGYTDGKIRVWGVGRTL